MPHINSVEFGSITVDNIKYDQILIVGNDVTERDHNKLKKTFGTCHMIGDWELEELLTENPEIIIIGTGHSGTFTVEENFVKEINKKGIELIIEKTPQAINSHNKKILEGKKVNALILTTS